MIRKKDLVNGYLSPEFESRNTSTLYKEKNYWFNSIKQLRAMFKKVGCVFRKTKEKRRLHIKNYCIPCNNLVTIIVPKRRKVLTGRRLINLKPT